MDDQPAGGRLRAVLFAVRGPIDGQYDDQAQLHEDIIRMLAWQRIKLSPAAYQIACEEAVETFAPDPFKSVIWRLSKQNENVARRVWDAVKPFHDDRYNFLLRPGIAEVIQGLHKRGIGLGLVSNADQRALESLAQVGLESCFEHFSVAGETGFRKPDTRAFLSACSWLRVSPEECLFVGGRVDIDVAPARMLGMTTIRFASGLHKSQRPRSWEEVPHWQVETVPELAQAIDKALEAV